MASAVESVARSEAGSAVRALANTKGTEEASPKKKQNPFQQCMPYRTEQESSIVSDWRIHYQNTEGKGVPFQRGLRFTDPRYATENSPGVCVIKGDDDVPKVPGLASNNAYFAPVADKQKVIDAVTTQLLQMGVALTNPIHGRTFGEHAKTFVEQSMQATRSTVRDKNASVQEPRGSRSSGLARSRASSEASLASTKIDRSKNLASTIARDRYQQYIIANPKKGHTFCEPELPTGANAEAARQVYGM